MKTSLKGHALPESAEDAAALASQNPMFAVCSICGLSLSDPKAAYTTAGWRETQISGICEPCFDSLFEDDDE